MSVQVDRVASLGQRIDAALRQRDTASALRLIAEAEAAGSNDPEIKMQKAVAQRVAGDFEGALKSLDEALSFDPYNFMALLAKGAMVERVLGERHAAETYRNALKIAPRDVPPGLGPAMVRAREVVAKTADALEAYLRDELKDVGADCRGEAAARFDESLRVFAGKARIYNSEPLFLHYPRLPAIPFHDRDLFPWLPKLEAATDTIRDELKTLLETKQGFAPYIDYPPGVPVNQWAELNHNPRWSSFFLWKDGERQDLACAQCPKTVALLESLPLADQPGFAPTAVFSALEAKTHIPPHTGSTNVRLLVHLPLILPGPARFRVGGETREWRMGEAWVFDDTIEHEAWNDASALRVILILDIWNPYLEPAERERVRVMLKARNRFFGR
jgi:aspartyl/asparaginyl beta-hydroxylase (cupin superfamily)